MVGVDLLKEWILFRYPPIEACFMESSLNCEPVHMMDRLSVASLTSRCVALTLSFEGWRVPVRVQVLSLSEEGSSCA